MKLKPTLVISLCLNLALAGAAALLVSLPKAVSPMPGTVPAKGSATTAAPVATAVPTPGNSPAQVTCITNHFTWCQIEAEDFGQLAVNLRAIGCPEKTVRDVAVARARRALGRISTSADLALPFWTAGMRRVGANREAERQAGLAYQQILAHLEHAVGQGVFPGDEKWIEEYELEIQGGASLLFGPLPDETRSKCIAILLRFISEQIRVDSRRHGVELDTDKAELAQAGAQALRQLAATLTPAQLDEVTARIGIIELALDRNMRFEATDLSTAELRQLALIRGPWTISKLLSGSAWTDEQEEQWALAGRRFLGEARFAQIERAADRDFLKLFELGRDHNLPRAAAVKVFELRQLAAQEAEQLRADQALSDVDREQRLAQMQAEAQQAVLQVLGASASWQYLGCGGAWLTNASKL